MDDDFNLGDFDSPAVGPPEVMEPFSQSDDLRLQRISHSLSAIQDEQDDGTLLPHEADEFRSMLMPQRNALLARRKSAMASQQQEQQANFLNDLAQQQAVQQANQSHNAQSFPDSVASFVDPETGKTKHFYPKGQYEPMDFGEPAPSESAGGEQSLDYMPIGLASVVQAQPTLADNGDGVHTMTIWNGPNRQEVDFQNGRTVAVRQWGREGNPVVPQAQQEASGDLMQEATRRMNRPEPPQYLAGPGGRPVINPAWVHYDTQRRQIHGRLLMQQQQQQRAEGARVETDYADALRSHPIKDYADADDPHAARRNAIMSDFALRHPNDPRVVQWRSERATKTDTPAERKAETASLLKNARKAGLKITDGQFLTMQSGMEREVDRDKEIAPTVNFQGKGESKPTRYEGKTWAELPAPLRQAEAHRRLTERLERASGKRLTPEPTIIDQSEGGAQPADVRVGEGRWTPQQIEAEHQRRMEADPEYAKAQKWADANQQAAQALSKLPSDASDEQKFLARVEAGAVGTNEMAALYDQNRDIKTKGDDMSGWSISARQTKEQKIAQDEESLARAARRTGRSVAWLKANKARWDKITPQSIKRAKGGD